MFKKGLILILVLGLVIALSGAADAKGSSGGGRSSGGGSFKSFSGGSNVKSSSVGSKLVGTTKITSSTPKSYSTTKYKSHGREYNHVSYGSGFDYSSLLLIGFVMQLDDDGKTVYVNNATNEIVTDEGLPESTPGVGFLSAMFLLFVGTVIKRKY
jgi:hypothetical protein